jgi:hypothetical protein
LLCISLHSLSAAEEKFVFLAATKQLGLFLLWFRRFTASRCGGALTDTRLPHLLHPTSTLVATKGAVLSPGLGMSLGMAKV